MLEAYPRGIIISLLFASVFCACQTNSSLSAGEGYLTVQEGKMWYRIIGEGDEIPIVMLHGGPGGTSWYLYALAELSEERPIILYDQLGTGRSGYHTDTTIMTLDSFVEQLDALIDTLNLNKFYLYGHSWGTTLALEYYLNHPRNVEALIFNSPCFSTSAWISDSDTLISTLHDTIQYAINTHTKNGTFDHPEFRAAEKVYLENFGYRQSSFDIDFDSEPKPGNDFMYNYMWGPTEFTATGTLRNYDRTDRLNEIEAPTLFVTGEFDEARPATVRYFHSLVPGSEFAIIEDAAHATMFDNQKQNLEAIEEFLRNLETKF